MLTKNLFRTSGHCHLLGGMFSSFVQGILAVLCIGTLIIKRQNETPRREWMVWFLDVMKQGLGAVFGHVANLYLSIVIAKSVTSGDECQWYCLTYVVDCAVGTILNLAFIRLCEKLYLKYPQLEFLDFGEYGNPPSLLLWTPQLIVWLSIVMLSKIIILLVLKHFISPLNTVIGWLFLIFDGNPDLELVFVMIIVPLVLNTLIFWVIDTFLKRHDHPQIVSPAVDHLHAHQPVPQNSDEENALIDASDDEGSLTHRPVFSGGNSGGGSRYERLTQNNPENSSSAGVSRKSRRKEKLSPVVSSTSIDQEGSLFSGWFGGASNTASLSTTPPKRIVSGVEMTTGSLNATANSSSRNPLSSASGSFRDRVVHRKKSESDVEADVAAALADLNGPKTSSLSAALISGSPSTSGSVSVEETQQQ